MSGVKSSGVKLSVMISVLWVIVLVGFLNMVLSVLFMLFVCL